MDDCAEFVGVAQESQARVMDASKWGVGTFITLSLAVAAAFFAVIIAFDAVFASDLMRYSHQTKTMRFAKHPEEAPDLSEISQCCSI